MGEARKKIFILWDRATAEVRTALQALVRRPPEGVDLSFADPERRSGDLLASVLSGIRAADRVLVIHPPDSAVVPLGFEMGLAIGLGKPIAIMEQLPAPAVYLSHSVVRLFGSRLPEETIASSSKQLRQRLPLNSFWYEVPLPEKYPESGPLFLCPYQGIGSELRDLIEELRPDWKGPEPERLSHEIAPLALGADRLLWIVPPAPPLEQWGNVLSALAAGLYYVRQAGETPDLEILRHREAPMLRSLERYCRTFSDLDELEEWLRPTEVPPTFHVQTLEIRNFKNIEHLKFDFSAEPSSPSFTGDWTCIAGINGSGKSSILQALVMVLLGDKLTAELGGDRILRMLRRTGEQRLPTEISAVVSDGQETHELRLLLSEQGVHDSWIDRNSDEYQNMLQAWQRLQNQVIVSYGASRNLSDYREDRHDGMSPRIRRQMTLFDPRTRIASIEALLTGGDSSTPVLRTLQKLLRSILAKETAPSIEGDRLLFGQAGISVEAIDLPDGFRSTVAWLADLCATWHETVPKEAATSDPTKIRGIVMLDEIDLHLHPGLQRALVPRLREALPNVQFFVTTHSPLVLSSFDRAELVALDRDEEGGIRELDRQIFGFSADQVYEYLMETSPQSVVIEETLEKGEDPGIALYLLQSEKRSEEEARVELEERRRLIEELLGSP
ncbi:MAG TPA: AAA family ATPase [Thermoanaerobaculia bacterium]|nr:AAA family ATPase [Thermoanaerobaculia bacterium]